MMLPKTQRDRLLALEEKGEEPPKQRTWEHDVILGRREFYFLIQELCLDSACLKGYFPLTLERFERPLQFCKTEDGDAPKCGVHNLGEVRGCHDRSIENN